MIGVEIGAVCSSLVWAVIVLLLLSTKRKIRDVEDQARRADQSVAEKQQEIDLHSQTIAELRAEVARLQTDIAVKEDTIQQDSARAHRLRQELERAHNDTIAAVRQERDQCVQKGEKHLSNSTLSREQQRWSARNSIERTKSSQAHFES
jgi:phage host-nuclease inhibitor protein Gam